MGLAYNLDVTLYDNFGKYLPNALVDFHTGAAAAASRTTTPR